MAADGEKQPIPGDVSPSTEMGPVSQVGSDSSDAPVVTLKTWIVSLVRFPNATLNLGTYEGG